MTGFLGRALPGGTLAHSSLLWPWRAWRRLRVLGRSRAHHAAKLHSHTDLAIRFYIEQDDESFERTYERARITAGGSLYGGERQEILLDTLRANLRVKRALSLGDDKGARPEIAAAARGYERLIEQLRDHHRETREGAVPATRETEFDWLEWQLAVLCHNAALAGAWAAEPVEAVAARIDEGLRYQPSLSGWFGWVWTAIDEWERARKLFAAAFAANPEDSAWRSHELYAAARCSEQLGEPGAARAWQEAAAAYKKHDPATARLCLEQRARVLAADGLLREALAVEEEAASFTERPGAGGTAAAEGDAPAGQPQAIEEEAPPTTGQIESSRRARAESHARRAVLFLELGSTEAAAVQLDAGIRLFRELPGGAHPHRQIVLAAEPLLTRPLARLGLRREIQTRLRAADPAPRRDLIAATRRLATLDASRFVSPPAPDTDQPIDSGAAQPIAIEVRLDRISAEAIQGSLIQATGRVRESLQAGFGVVMPGVRFRDITEPVAGTDYHILMMDIEVERGELPREEGAAIVELLSRLGRLLISRLDQLVGHQETRQLIGRVVEFDSEETLAEREALDGVGPLCRLLRALLRERASIAALDRIYAEFQRLRALGATEELVVEKIRVLPEVRAELWGNGPHEPWLVPREIERPLEEARRSVGGWSILELEPAERDRLLAALVALATGSGAAAERRALVVRGDRLRPLVRKLIEEALPETPVLSLAELSPDREGALQGPPTGGGERTDDG